MRIFKNSSSLEDNIDHRTFDTKIDFPTDLKSCYKLDILWQLLYQAGKRH